MRETNDKPPKLVLYHQIMCHGCPRLTSCSGNLDLPGACTLDGIALFPLRNGPLEIRKTMNSLY